MQSEAGREKALARAYRALAIRPRSELEIRQSLRRWGFAEDTAQEVVSRLKDQGLLDDQAFAESWTKSRMRFRPRSKHLIRRELTRKGISHEEAAEATGGIDDDETALALARQRILRLKGIDRETLVRRLASYLQTRGFSRSTVTRTIATVLAEDEFEPS